jgi:glutamyl-tRNA synthetase
MEDLKWIGLDWDEGPVLGGPHSPYAQSERLRDYLKVLDFLWSIDLAYPSPHSRKEIIEAGSGSVGADGESLFPEKLRQPKGALPPSRTQATPWRLRVPPCQPMNFVDGRLGPQSFTAGKDFGDFLLWRREGVPAYELAVVVDDIAMKITEVVRGEDLLLSTARQLLIYEALQAKSPDWYHAPLLKDPQSGQRLAKTHHSLGLRQLRESGKKVAFPAPGTPQVSL